MVEENDFLDLIKELIDANIIKSPVDISRIKHYTFNDIYSAIQNRYYKPKTKEAFVEAIEKIFDKYNATTIDDLTPNKYKASFYEDEVPSLLINSFYDIYKNAGKYASNNTKKLLDNEEKLEKETAKTYQKIGEYKKDIENQKKIRKQLKKKKHQP